MSAFSRRPWGLASLDLEIVWISIHLWFPFVLLLVSFVADRGGPVPGSLCWVSRGGKVRKGDLALAPVDFTTTLGPKGPTDMVNSTPASARLLVLFRLILLVCIGVDKHRYDNMVLVVSSSLYLGHGPHWFG